MQRYQYEPDVLPFLLFPTSPPFRLDDVLLLGCHILEALMGMFIRISPFAFGGRRAMLVATASHRDTQSSVGH